MKRLLNRLPPVATIILALVFCFANPYTSKALNGSTVVIIFVALILPAVLVLISIPFRNNMLKSIGFCLSLPCGLYLGLAGIPSYWALIIVFIAFYPFIKIRGQ
ncbi:hypothetical protein ACFPVX_16730 [Cohnella faecalis]